MSPVVQKKGERAKVSGKSLLFLFTIICLLLMLITFSTDILNKPLFSAVGYVVVPFQNGIGKMGGWLSTRTEELAQIRILLAENERLKAENAELIEKNTLLQQGQYELNSLRDLLELSDQYAEYTKVGARVIARDSGNWYSKFVIDKGSEDGIAVDMNVLSGGGLVGKISAVGPNWARVTTIICDNVNVSGMTLSSMDNLIVSGDLKLMADNTISFSQLVDSKEQVREGDKIVTSNISDKYLPNLLIGYISSIEKDNNNLTKSGLVTPAVDFEHIEQVLVITEMKQSIDDEN